MIGVEMQLGFEFARQALHSPVVGAAGEVDLDDLLRLGGDNQLLEQSNTEPASAILALNAEGRLRMASLSMREFVRRIRDDRAQLARAAQLPVDTSADDDVARREAMIRVPIEELVRRAAMKSVVTTFRIEAKEMRAEGFSLRGG
jgi:hypothetical protein